MAKVRGQGRTCFIGFSPDETQELKAMARKAGLRPTQPTDHYIAYAVKGAGTIQEQLTMLPPMATIMTRDDFFALLNDPEFLASIPVQADPIREKPTDYMRVCFTGFSDGEKKELKKLAKKADLQCDRDMSSGAGILVIGPKKPGEKKLREAEKSNARVMTKEDFLEMISDFRSS